MRLKLLLTCVLSTVVFSANAQDEIFWSGSSLNGYWDWGLGCTVNAGGNWYWNSSGTGTRLRPDCNGTFNIVKFDNNINTTMILNSDFDFSVNRLLFLLGTSDRTISTNNGRRVFFQNNNGNCKIENHVAFTTHTFNVDIFVNSGGNYMEINPVNGYLLFNNPIRNNSDNPINVYGAQQVTFSGDIAGTPGVTINNTATVVYSGVSKTYSGTTTINSGTKLKISTNQTLGNIVLNGGTLQVDAGVTLTITGTYTATGGTIDNKGTMKFVGGSITFPGNANVNNGVANTLASFEAASSGIVTINSILNVTNSITVSAGTLMLSGNNLHLNNATLNVAAGGTFDNGGENQIINGGGTINISGTFITRDAQGFEGINTAIPTITPTLISGSTIEYGLNGNQVVQGSRSYFNLTFSNSGTKTLSSAISNLNTITGTVTIKDAAIVDSGSHTFGDSNNTNLTMTGTSRLIVSGARSVPDMTGTYSLSGGTIEFAGNSNSHTARSPKTYNNMVISGANVNGSAGNYTLNNGAVFTVNAGAIFTVSDQRIIAGGASAIININGTFVTKDADGFSGTNATSISPNNTIINLGIGSTIEYAKTGTNGDQTITSFSPAYSNLNISGSGIKKAVTTTINISNNLYIKSAQLTIQPLQTFEVKNNLTVNSGANLVVEDEGSLVMINDSGIVTNDGTTNIHRQTSPFEPNDYTYWSTPIVSTNIENTFTAPYSFPNDWHTENSFEFIPANYIDEDGDGFDDDHNDWSFVSSMTMTPGKGYIIMVPYRPIPFPLDTQSEVIFSGKVNNGVVLTPIALTPDVIPAVADDDFNLVGNPYPSAISADAFINANISTNGTAYNTIEGTLYFWTHIKDLSSSNSGPDTYNYSQDDYAVYTLAGGTAAGSGGVKPLGYIASCQGFFVEAVNSGTLIFNNAMRVGLPSTANSQFYKSRPGKSKIATKDRIWLNLENSLGMFSQQLVGYFDNTTLGYDNGYDGSLSAGGNCVNFYSFIDKDTYKIQGRPTFDENDQVRLGFSSAIAGTFNINIDSKEGVFSNLSTSVYLEDKVTHVIHDLKQSPYTFTTEKGTFNDRFILRYTNKTLEITDLETLENQVLVSHKNQQIKVNSVLEMIDKVVVYDLLGGQIYKKEKVKSNELSIPNLVSSQQIVLVKVILQNGNSITKKVIY